LIVLSSFVGRDLLYCDIKRAGRNGLMLNHLAVGSLTLNHSEGDRLALNHLGDSLIIKP